MPGIQDIPVPASDYGARAYDRGRRLVEEHGLRLDEIAWDADEVLWDWLMDASEILGDVGRLIRRDVGHREWVMPKPGVFELLWGMRHASLEVDQPAHLRIWTDGYPWRLWRIAREIPGFAELVGPPADASEGAWETFRDHPRIFSRVDFAEVAERLCWPGPRRRLLSECSARSRAVIDEQFRRDPYDSNFKIPELASFAGTDAFEDVRVLVDDRRENVARFVATDRWGVRVVSDTPRVLFGAVPNTVWRRPERRLDALDNAIGAPLAEGLERIIGASNPTSVRAEPDPEPEEYPRRKFAIEVPDERLRDEWLEPMRELRDRAAF